MSELKNRGKWDRLHRKENALKQDYSLLPNQSFTAISTYESDDEKQIVEIKRSYLKIFATASFTYEDCTFKFGDKLETFAARNELPKKQPATKKRFNQLLRFAQLDYDQAKASLEDAAVTFEPVIEDDELFIKFQVVPKQEPSFFCKIRYNTKAHPDFRFAN